MSDIEQEAHWLDRNQDYWQARAEAAERKHAQALEGRDIAESQQAKAEATLAAVRSLGEELQNNPPRSVERFIADAFLAILDGEGE